MSDDTHLIEGYLDETDGDAPPPTFMSPVMREVARVTGQVHELSLCAFCPLAHWELSFDALPPLDAPLQPPAMGAARWLLDCHCRVRHAYTAQLEPNPETPGKLKRAANTRLVFRCSDHGPAVEEWAKRNQD